MIAGSSAVVAVVFREPGFADLLGKISGSASCAIAAPNLVEAAIVASARLGRDARPLLARLPGEAGIVTLPFTDARFGTAVGAWLRYRKGRHAAALNFGDGIAYAVARRTGRPLLCVGDDFRRTDVALA